MFATKKLSDLEKNDVILGKCFKLNPNHSENYIKFKNGEKVVRAKDFEKYDKLNFQCGKLFVVTSKEESCILNYGSEPESFHKFKFEEINSNLSIKTDGIKFEKDNHWTSNIFKNHLPLKDLIVEESNDTFQVLSS